MKQEISNLLLHYGFQKKNGIFILEKDFLNHQFKAYFQVDRTGQLTGKVYDNDTEEIYTPFSVKNWNTGYVKQVKNAYQNLLNDIQNSCFPKRFFLSEQANHLAELLQKTYQTLPDFP